MESRVKSIIENLKDFNAIHQFEKNALAQNALDVEMQSAIHARASELARILIAERTNLNFANLTQAEEKIVKAVAEYVGILRRDKKDATRTLKQIKDNGLIKAAELSVERSKPTQGFEKLHAAGKSDLLYEQIIIDHPEEFSERSLWFARKTLGIPNSSDKAPAKEDNLTQQRTEIIIDWFKTQAKNNNGIIFGHTNNDVAAVLKIDDMHRFGRVLGNIQSRIDFACYVLKLPALGLTAKAPFENAWQQEDREWTFPIQEMQIAAQTYSWTIEELNDVLTKTRTLPGLAHVSWRRELEQSEQNVRDWADAFAAGIGSSNLAGTNKVTRNPAWTRNELILALKLYLDNRASPPGKHSQEVREISLLLNKLNASTAGNYSSTFRNDNGVYMKMMNFRSHDPEYRTEGKVGLSRGNKLEEELWDLYADDSESLDQAARGIIDLIHEGSHEPLSQNEIDCLRKLELEAQNKSPERRERTSSMIERGPIGAKLKRLAGFKCQICEAMGIPSKGFLKKNEIPYVEAHHVMPVSKLKTGLLSAANILIVCANHHRQLHYGQVEVTPKKTGFDIVIDEILITVPHILPCDSESEQ